MAIEQLLQEIEKLPGLWHRAGSSNIDMLRAIVKYTQGQSIQYSAETGSGKSTLLLSHLSKEHLVFALNNKDSIAAPHSSTLLNAEAVTFIEGPTQITLPQYTFSDKLQLVLLDGPHGYPFPDLEYYFIYPHLDTNALLVIDDIHIATIRNLYHYLKRDRMFTFLGLVESTAFFRRTDSPMHDPLGDGWRDQSYNTRLLLFYWIWYKMRLTTVRRWYRRLKAKQRIFYTTYYE
jgi:hypothetical protein